MICMLFTFEDHTISLKRGGRDWGVVICEHQTGAEKEYIWDDQLLSAVMCLAIGGDTYDADIRDYLYAVTDIIDWEQDGIDFRIIP